MATNKAQNQILIEIGIYLSRRFFMQPDQYESKRKERVKQNIFHNEQSILQSYLEWRIMVVLNVRQYFFIRFIFIAFFFFLPWPLRKQYGSKMQKCLPARFDLYFEIGVFDEI